MSPHASRCVYCAAPAARQSRFRGPGRYKRHLHSAVYGVFAEENSL
jgi:hypothetical protein